MEIDLDSNDLILAAHNVGIMQAVKKARLDNRQIKNNKICGQTDFAVHYIGMLGEIAVCKYLGVNVRFDITYGGDGNVDLTIKNQSIQIKTSSILRPEPRYLIFNSMEDFATDWAVYCSVQSPTIIKIHGFVGKEKFKLNHEIQNFGYGDRYCLNDKYLTDIERFNEAIEWFSKK
jgi:hypothetical protein